MAITAEHYSGREQALVKHHFLKHYLESLVHKIASVYDEVVYVDGFSGPWQHRGEAFEDTSFGIALSALTDAKRSWAGMQSGARHVNMIAHLVEKDPASYVKLAELNLLFPEVKIITYNDDFVRISSKIARAIPARAFTFIFVDPTGFSVDLEALRPLISRDHCEIVFNFMFDFINRFALSEDPVVAGILDKLIPGEDWRGPLRALDTDVNTTPERRKRALVDAFSRAVARIGGYRYVADVDVRRPDRDRTLYFLVYGTRQSAGLKVYRDCQIKSLNVQSEVLARKKVADRSSSSNQFEMLGSMHDMAPDQNLAFLTAENANARAMMLDIVPSTGSGAAWSTIWPKVLAKHVVRLTDLNRAANELRKEQKLTFPTWAGARKSVPDDNYLVLRGPKASG